MTDDPRIAMYTTSTPGADEVYAPLTMLYASAFALLGFTDRTVARALGRLQEAAISVDADAIVDVRVSCKWFGTVIATATAVQVFTSSTEPDQ